MRVRIPTAKGQLEIELAERNAPLACRCLRQQIDSGVWNGSAFEHATDACLRLTTGKPVVQIAKESYRTKIQRGTVAYSSSSTAELVFVRQGGPVRNLGTIVGQLTPQSVFVAEDIASGPKSNDRLTYPVLVGPSKARNADLNPARPATKRKIGVRLADDRSEQLKQVMDFESRLHELGAR